ncbi:hypothetical protein [Enterovibrio baiacu]|uniref:hypothetical protein n=1 Tax=Enterovibrio baiacu TaxID=2491023 RepID=UPI003D0B7AF6
MPNQQDQNGLLDRPLVLPCGAVLKNRLIKSAMSDSLGDGAGNATAPQARLYEKWAEGGVAFNVVKRHSAPKGALCVCREAR